MGPGHRLRHCSSSVPSGSSGQDASRGFSVWVDSVDDLVTALSVEDSRADLEHLFALPEGGGDAASGGGSTTVRSTVEDIYFPRDVGVRAGHPSASSQHPGFPWGGVSGALTPCHDGYACLQVDDFSNPWAFYAVAEGTDAGRWSSPQGPQELSPKLAADLPAMLTRNPRLHVNPCRALYETHMAATKVAAMGNVYPDTNEGLSLVMLRDEFLHIAWAGDAKIVLGRLASKAPVTPVKTAPDPITQQGSLRLASRNRPGAGRTPQEGYINSKQLKQLIDFDGTPPILRAVELTAQSDLPSGVSAGDSAGGGGQSSRAGEAQGKADGTPNVRRMKLKPEDVCVVIATQALWNCLSPEEVVTIVGQRLNRMAADAANALVVEVRRRTMPFASAEDDPALDQELTVMVIYLAGERYVKDFEIERSNHLAGDYFTSEGLMPAKDIPGLPWGCCRGRGTELPGGYGGHGAELPGGYGYGYG